MINIFGRTQQRESSENPDIGGLEQYKEDFKAFMEKSHLQFFRENPGDTESYYVGYKIHPNRTDIWLYALIRSDIIAAGLRAQDKRKLRTLENQKSDIQLYFVEDLGWNSNYVGITRYNIDTTDINDQDEQFYFLRKTLETLYVAFQDRVANLD